MVGGGADAQTGASSAWRDVPPEGPPRWEKRQWILLGLAVFLPLVLLLLAMTFVGR